MDLRTLATPSTAARATLRLIGQGPAPAYAGYEVPLDDIDIRISAALSLSGYATKLTWPELAAVTGTPGAFAIIPLHAGTHVDPVTGATVQNTGVYKWSVSPAGWERKFDTQALAAQQVLLDPGFVLVSGDLALGGASKIGTVSTNIAAITGVHGALAAINALVPALTAIGTVSTNIGAVNNVSTNIAAVNNVSTNMAAILAAPTVLADIQAAVTTASTLLGALFTTSYTGPYSQGDRVAALTSNGASIKTGLSISGGGNINNLFNGSTTNDNTGGVVLTGLALTAAQIVEVIFPKGVWQLCDEFQILNSGTQSYGTGILYGLKPDGTWAAVSADAANGGATTVTRAATATEKTGYGGFRLVGTGGTAGSGRMLEMKLKLCPGTLNGTVPVPPSTDQDKVLTQGSGIQGDMVWAKPLGYLETRVQGKGLLRSFPFDQNDDEGAVYDRAGSGTSIDLAAMVTAWGGKISRVREGRLLEKALFQTASLTNIRTAVMVLIPDYEDGSSTYMASTANNGGQINLSYATGGRFASTSIVHAGHGGIEVQPVHHTSGQFARKLGRGGPMMIFYEAAAQFTQKFAVGGLVDVTDPVGRVVRMKIAYLDLYTGQLDATDKTFIRRGLRRTMALRGIFFDYRDCPTQVVCRLLNGQSNGNGDAFIAEMAAGDQLRTWTPYCDIMTGIADSNGTPLWSFATPSQFRLGFNHRLVLTDRMGPEVGMVFAHEEAANVRKLRLAINKFCVSSTALEGHWKWTNSPASGLYWLGMSNWWAMEQHYLARGIGPKLIGQDWNQWQNDAITSGFAAAYEANIGANWTKTKEQTGYSSGGLRMTIAQPGDPDNNYPYFSTIDTAITNFDNANDDVTKISVAGLSYREISPNKRVHFTADSYVLYGRRCDAANPSI